MARLLAVWMGPASSTGSPITFMMRPSVSSPTGTAIGWPVSVTSWPRVSPSVESMATVRTERSPRCWATSSTRRPPWFCGLQRVQDLGQVALELHVDDGAHDLANLTDFVGCHDCFFLRPRLSVPFAVLGLRCA